MKTVAGTIFSGLQLNNPDLKNSLDGHDEFHLYAHPGYEYPEDLEKLPLLRASPHHEAIVTLTEIIIRNCHPRFSRVDGRILGANRGSSAARHNDQDVHDVRPMTFDEIKAVIGIEKVIDKQKKITEKAKKDFYAKHFDHLSPLDQFKQYLDHALTQTTCEQVNDSFMWDDPITFKSTDEQGRKAEIMAHSAIQEIADDIDWRSMSRTANLLWLEIEKYKLSEFDQHYEHSPEKKEIDKLEQSLDDETYQCPFSDNALRFYIKRAEIMKQQLADAGWPDLSNITISDIPLEHFAVPKAKVMAALEADAKSAKQKGEEVQITSVPHEVELQTQAKGAHNRDLTGHTGR